MKPLIIAAAAVLTQGVVLAQDHPQDPSKDRTKDRTQERAKERDRMQDPSKARDAVPTTPVFVTAETLLDAKVKSATDADNEADIDDLIVDTRNGKILYAIVDTNGILGSEDKVVGLPYGALQWSAAHKSYTLNATAEQIANMPKWDSDDWARFRDDNWFSTLRGIFGDRDEFRDSADYRGDEYTPYFAEGRAETLKGKVVSIDREARTTKNTSYCAVVIEPADKAAKDKAGSNRHIVLLAPVSHLERESVTIPKEGSEVTVTTISAYNARGEKVRVAQTLNVDGKTVQLRDASGVPSWEAGDDDKNKSHYMMRASKMTSGSLQAQGEEVGDVHQTVFEPYSGTLAFVVISVGGVLGIDDTLYPIPAGAVTAGPDNDLFIDMSKSKLRLAPKLSAEGVEDLNNDTFASSVTEYYGVKPREYNLERSHHWCEEDRKNPGQ